jgi:hypothetical protein
MKNQEIISQLKQHEISSILATKINGGDKKITAKAEEEIE